MHRLNVRRLSRTLTAALAVLGSFANPPAVAREGSPLRSGAIEGGIYSTGPWQCRGAPDCRLWLDSGCEADMRGPQDPALFTSIVDVEDLAGSPAQRRFKGTLREPYPRVHAGGLILEFWTAGCEKIRLDTRDPMGGDRYIAVGILREAVLRIPVGAKWMTVVASDVLRVDWKLTEVGSLASVGSASGTEFRCGEAQATILGTGQDDVLAGTSQRDVILGLGGDDVIRALEGRDVICGGLGDDRIFGGGGYDICLGGSGSDVIRRCGTGRRVP